MTFKEEGIIWVLLDGTDKTFRGAFNSERIAAAACEYYQNRFPNRNFYITPEFVGYYWTEEIEKELDEAYGFC